MSDQNIWGKLGEGVKKRIFYSQADQWSLFCVICMKPLEKKLLFLADFIIKLGPFYKKNSILTLFTDPKAKRSENAPNNQILPPKYIKNWPFNTCIYIKS